MLRSVARDPTGCSTAYLRAYSQMLGRRARERAQYLALSAAQYNCSVLFDGLRAWQPLSDWFPIKAWYGDAGSHVIAEIAEFRTACLARAPDEIVKLVVIGSDGVHTLSLATGEDLGGLVFPGSDVESAIEIPNRDDILVALAHRSGEVSVLNVTQRKELWRREMTSETRAPKLCVMNRDRDQFLVAGTEDGKVSVWSLSDFRRLHAWGAHKAGMTFIATGSLQDKTVLITCSDAYERGRVVEKKQVRLWDANSFDLIRAFSGPEGSLAQWTSLLDVAGTPYLVTYFYPRSRVCVHNPETGKEVASLYDANLRPFGSALEGKAAEVFSGFSNAFSWVRLDRNGNSVHITATASVNVEGGQWLGPVDAGGRRLLVSVGNNVRVWDATRLKERSSKAIEAKVGVVDDQGEPLFWVSAPRVRRCFAGLSRYGNLRIWSADGECLVLRQLIVSLDNASADDYDHLQMVDFGGDCLYVTAGRSGAIQAWDLNGNHVYSYLRVDGAIHSFFVYESGPALLAVAGIGNGGRHKIGVWDLVSGAEITSKGRFEMESYDDKTINYVAGIEHKGTRIVVGALGHSYYHKIGAWDLDDEPIPASLQHAYRVPARKQLWDRNAERQITCVTPVGRSGNPVIAFGDEKGWITVLDAPKGGLLATYRAHSKQVTALTWLEAGSKTVVISAGSEGRIVGCDITPQVEKRRPHSPGPLFTIHTGDRINAVTAVTGGRVVAGTEQGFLLFQLTEYLQTGAPYGVDPHF